VSYSESKGKKRVPHQKKDGQAILAPSKKAEDRVNGNTQILEIKVTKESEGSYIKHKMTLNKDRKTLNITKEKSKTLK